MRTIVAALVSAGLACLAAGSARAQPVSGAELLAEITGNTVTGYHSGGVYFSEYHAADGRVFGFNNAEPVEEGCWTVRDDAVCYYYGSGTITGNFCWRFDRAGSQGYRIRHTRSASAGVARLEPGNPRDFSDNGRSWTCEALMSRAPGLAPPSGEADGPQRRRLTASQAWRAVAARQASPQMPVTRPQ